MSIVTDYQSSLARRPSCPAWCAGHTDEEPDPLGHASPPRVMRLSRSLDGGETIVTTCDVLGPGVVLDVVRRPADLSPAEAVALAGHLLASAREADPELTTRLTDDAEVGLMMEAVERAFRAGLIEDGRAA